MSKTAWLLASSLGLALHVACSGSGSPTKSTPPTPVNHAPVITSIAASPSGTGLASATIFTFTAQGVSDPDGDTLTYSWSVSDGAPAVSSTAALAHVFARAGTFDVKLVVTDPSGATASSTRSVTIGTLNGTWDISCDSIPNSTRSFWPAYPSHFVVTINQSESSLFGTISGGSYSQTFPAPPSVGVADAVSDPKKANFGVEGAFNPWTQRDGDMYFHLTADDSLSTMAGTGGYCGPATARKR